MKYLFYWVMIALVLASCTNVRGQRADELYFIDFIGDEKIDTLRVEKRDNFTLRVFHQQNEQATEICTVAIDEPQHTILNFEPQHNGHIKGFRLLFKNIVTIPNYKYVDIVWNKLWEIERIGKINTNNLGDLFSCYQNYTADMAIYNSTKSQSLQINVNELVDRTKDQNWICK